MTPGRPASPRSRHNKPPPTPMMHLPAIEPLRDDAERVVVPPVHRGTADAEAVAELLPRHPVCALPHQVRIVPLEEAVPGDGLLHAADREGRGSGRRIGTGSAPTRSPKLRTISGQLLK
jgi:hypothetical protein